MNQARTLEPVLMQKSQVPQVVILGQKGTFHDMAARCYFKERTINVLPTNSFEQVVAEVEQNQAARLGVMAIENTLAGSLLYNYNLIEQSNLEIVGEVYLRIRQNLLVFPGQSLQDLREVRSHPMAIEQCRSFFEAYPHIRMVETSDTATAAEAIRARQLRHVGAIASTLAAEMHELDILAPGIETNKKNYTRFWIIQPRSECPKWEDTNKVSLCFVLDHEVGHLHRILSVFAAYNLNLTKIQSTPIPGKPWEYRFFIDFEVCGNLGWAQAMTAIEPLVASVKVLGAYQKGTYFEY